MMENNEEKATAPDRQDRERLQDMKVAEGTAMTKEDLIKQYTKHMRQVLHHQQEAYFCMIKILSTLGMDNDF